MDQTRGQPQNLKISFQEWYIDAGQVNRWLSASLKDDEQGVCDSGRCCGVAGVLYPLPYGRKKFP
jgi:hypothetical protein